MANTNDDNCMHHVTGMCVYPWIVSFFLAFLFADFMHNGFIIIAQNANIIRRITKYF